MKLLLIDNYDSFTYNLAHYFEALGAEVLVCRNQDFSWDEVDLADGIILSPGPGLPSEAGMCMELISRYAESKPIIGICLGAQAIAEHFGAKLYNQKEVAHGISRQVYRQNESWLLSGLEECFAVGLYHSWGIKPSPTFTQKFAVVAQRGNGVLMAFEDANSALAGIQYHPESIMTEGGRETLNNWLNRIKSLKR